MKTLEEEVKAEIEEEANTLNQSKKNKLMKHPVQTTQSHT